MKFLIVGLGNPGSEYKNTRHNIGFDVLDSLAKQKEQEFESLRYGDICKVKHKGRSLILLKPSTFMNLSGKAVNYWMQQEEHQHIRLMQLYHILDMQDKIKRVNQEFQ